MTGKTACPTLRSCGGGAFASRLRLPILIVSLTCGVRRCVFSTPQPARGPIFRRPLPEGIARRQAQRQQNRGTEIQAPRRNVILAQVRLVSAEADRQPAVIVERRSEEHTSELQSTM